MIAVFAKDLQQLSTIRLTPRELFVVVRNPSDIVGRTFIGMIKLDFWFEGAKEIRDAMEELRKRQPELF